MERKITNTQWKKGTMDRRTTNTQWKERRQTHTGQKDNKHTADIKK